MNITLAEPMRQTTFRLPEETIEKLDRWAKHERLNRSEVLRRLLEAIPEPPEGISLSDIEKLFRGK
jgi:Arc/MetJ-type ribon-helix-helix transcriptional regulator